jgi:hypothetical protein
MSGCERPGKERPIVGKREFGIFAVPHVFDDNGYILRERIVTGIFPHCVDQINGDSGGALQPVGKALQRTTIASHMMFQHDRTIPGQNGFKGVAEMKRGWAKSDQPVQIELRYRNKHCDKEKTEEYLQEDVGFRHGIVLCVFR